MIDLFIAFMIGANVGAAVMAMLAAHGQQDKRVPPGVKPNGR